MSRSLVSALAFLALGLGTTFGPVLRSGLERIPGDRSDTIHLHFVLEHGWQWLVSGAAAPSFWSPTIGHPMAGALAHGDVMLGFGPLYWPWRALGASPETAWALWVLGVCAANYAAMWALLRWTFRVGPLAASFGAWVFAFSSPLLAQLGHPQLLPQFYAIGALAAVWQLFRDPLPAARPIGGLAPDPDSPGAATDATDEQTRRVRRERLAIAAFTSCLVIQLWSGFYVGYFMALISGVAFLTASCRRGTRIRLLALLRARAASLALAGLAAAAFLAPLASRYLAARAASRPVGVGSGELRLPRLASYLFTGPESRLYGWMARLPPFSDLPEPHEQAIGLGFITTAVLVWMAWRFRHVPATRFAALVVVVLIVALTWGPFEIRLWRLWYYTIPGLGAVRAVSRIGIFLTIPAAIAIARLVYEARSSGRPRLAIAVAIALLCGAEQMRRVATYDGVVWQCELRRLAEVVDPDTTAFHLMGDRLDNLQALALAQRTGVPTINFVGGAFPTDWTLFETQVHRPDRDPRALRQARRQYLDSRGLDPASVQEIDPRSIQAACRAARTPPSTGPAHQARSIRGGPNRPPIGEDEAAPSTP